MVSDRTVLPLIRCLGFVGYRSWREKNEFRCIYALSTLPKRTTLPIEPSSGQYSPVLAYHIIRSRSFVNSTMACEHARVSTTGCTRSGSLWNKALSRMRARSPPGQHLLCGGYKYGLRAFRGGQRHHGRFGTPEEEKRGGGAGGAGGSNCRRVSSGDAALGHALC